MWNERAGRLGRAVALRAALVASCVAWVPVAHARVTGSPARHANDPPAPAANCTESGCHSTAGPLNSFDVALRLLTATSRAPLAGYAPGVARMSLVLRVDTTEAGRKRWGLQLIPLAGTTMAGTLTLAQGGFTALRTDAGFPERQYLQHTSIGTFATTTAAAGAEWAFNWTPPVTNVGDVVFYACANAADNSNTPTGDQIECTTFVVGVDSDADGTPDSVDTCPSIPDPGQADADSDGRGDACDPCPGVPGESPLDGDADGTPDACDTCVDESNPDQADTDSDGDGDACDNCIVFANADQSDADAGGLGDACKLPWGDVAPIAGLDGRITALDGVRCARIALGLDVPDLAAFRCANVSPATMIPGEPDVVTPTPQADPSPKVDAADVALLMRAIVGAARFTEPR